MRDLLSVAQELHTLVHRSNADPVDAATRGPALLRVAMDMGLFSGKEWAKLRLDVMEPPSDKPDDMTSNWLTWTQFAEKNADIRAWDAACHHLARECVPPRHGDLFRLQSWLTAGRIVAAMVMAEATRKTRTTKITVEEADAVARKLAKKNASFVTGTAEEWATRIGGETGKTCSSTTVKATRFWKEEMDRQGRSRSKNRPSKPLGGGALHWASEDNDPAKDAENRELSILLDEAARYAGERNLTQTEHDALLKQLVNGETNLKQFKELADTLSRPHSTQRARSRD